MSTVTTEVGQKLAQIQAWPHWDEISLCAQKEYGLTPEEFQVRLPEYQRFLALCAIHPGLGMTSPAIDQLWHSHILHTARYEEFGEMIGKKLHHMPCSSYILYGVQPADANDECQMCRVPTTCYNKVVGEADIAASILAGAQKFRDAYQNAFGVVPPIWNRNQIADGLAV